MKTFKKLILDDLKASGNGAIASKIVSIKYRSFSGGDAVDIRAIDLTCEEREILGALAYEYENSSFDGMIDLSFPKESKKERSAKYVHVQVDYSSSMVEKAKKYLKDQWWIENDEQAKQTFGHWLDTVVGWVLRGERQFKGAI